MENYEAFIAGIDEVVNRIKGLYDLAYAQYSHAVDEVISGRLTDEKQIEHILDGIIDFGDSGQALFEAASKGDAVETLKRLQNCTEPLISNSACRNLESYMSYMKKADTSTNWSSWRL